MAKGIDVLQMLRPNGGWVIYGDDFDSIIYDENVQPLSKKDFAEGFIQFDKMKAEKDAIQASNKAALLERLGITAEEAKLLLA